MWGRLAVIGLAATTAALASCGFQANGAAPSDGAQAGTDAPGNGTGTNGSGSGSGSNGSGSNGGSNGGSGGSGQGSSGSGNGSGNGSNGNGSGSGGPRCPNGYTLTDAGHPGSFYKQVTASTTWAAAETDCENDATAGSAPAHLIVLDDQAEAAFAWSTNTSDQWVGHSDLVTEGDWLPVTDQTNVFTGNATGNNTNKDCLEVTQSSGQTTAETCTNGHPYLCECDGLAADPANQ